MSKIKRILIIFLIASANVFADKDILYSDKNITIYTDNTMTYTDKKTAPVFKPSNSVLFFFLFLSFNMTSKPRPIRSNSTI